LNPTGLGEILAMLLSTIDLICIVCEFKKGTGPKKYFLNEDFFAF
jgi:hypothetical protein